MPGDDGVSITAAQSFLLVAPAAASRQLFTNFTRVVNDYLERPPFNFPNTHKHLGILKKVTISGVNQQQKAFGELILPRSWKEFLCPKEDIADILVTRDGSYVTTKDVVI